MYLVYLCIHLFSIAIDYTCENKKIASINQQHSFHTMKKQWKILLAISHFKTETLNM